MSRTIYHYTDSNALIGILTHKKLWLNDVQFMNDRDEVFDSLNTIKDLLEINQDSSFLKNFYEYATYHCYASGVPSLQNHGHMIASFCRESDILEMWRGYGNSGQKYCIGFDADVLHKCAIQTFGSRHICLVDCLYDENEKREELQEYFDESNSSSHGFEELFTLLLSMKNKDFSNEQEVRLIGLFNYRNEAEHKTLKHRSSPMGIIPYREIELKCVDERPLIKEIMIGPTEYKEQCESAVDSLLYYSHHLSLQANDSDNPCLFNTPEEVQINHSKISFRR